MSNSNDYDNGYWFGKDSGYREGYEEGVQAERNRIKRAVDGSSNLSTSESSVLGSMIGGSIILTILGWCWIGLIIFLLWIGGQSESWWFPWIWRIAFWGGIGFIVIMSILGIIIAITECCVDKNDSEKSTDIPKPPQHDEYPPKEKFKAYPVKDSSMPWCEEDSPDDVIKDQNKNRQ